MRRLGTAAGLALLVAVALAGCGETRTAALGEPAPAASDAPTEDPTDDPTDEPTAEPSGDLPESTADPADGLKLTGKDYAYAVPKGWVDINSTMGGLTDTAAGDAEDGDSFSDNVNVIRLSPAPITDLDKLEEASETELGTAKAEDVEVLERWSVAGEEAVHISSTLSSGDATYTVEQYNALRDGNSYVITFSHSPDLSDEERHADIDAILASWEWTG